MKEGHLPIRYLGVLLISTKLSAADCQVLLEKITSRMESWTSKNLSFAADYSFFLSSFIAFKYTGQEFLSCQIKF
jgi:hypothetical protein